MRTNMWLCILSGIALLGIVVSAPIRSQTLTPPPSPSYLSRSFPSPSNDCWLAFTSVSPDLEASKPDYVEFEEEEEKDLFGSFSDFVCLVVFPSHLPPKLLSGPRPGSSPPATAAVPLRC